MHSLWRTIHHMDAMVVQLTPSISGTTISISDMPEAKDARQLPLVCFLYTEWALHWRTSARRPVKPCAPAPVRRPVVWGLSRARCCEGSLEQTERRAGGRAHASVAPCRPPPRSLKGNVKVADCTAAAAGRLTTRSSSEPARHGERRWASNVPGRQANPSPCVSGSARNARESSATQASLFTSAMESAPQACMPGRNVGASAWSGCAATFARSAALTLPTQHKLPESKAGASAWSGCAATLAKSEGLTSPSQPKLPESKAGAPAWSRCAATFAKSVGLTSPIHPRLPGTKSGAADRKCWRSLGSSIQGKCSA
mmetsp:Transcript_33109/g.66917  ORF Transcript_33109/g.66917 Transcript_33109/m.66917 type:complete len:312 (-) Transcript_33109:287-1222(-)